VILVDTSVWIDHLRSTIPALVDLLEIDDVVMHPFIIGELACGTMRDRLEILDLLAELPSAVIGTDDETLEYIENHRLMGKGIGYIDAHLLVSVALTDDAFLWTRDKSLKAIATNMGLAADLT
jgi:predicted nucleic acid-binding protein